MNWFFAQLRSPRSTTGTCVAIILLCIHLPGLALAEWYVAGYGGYSSPGSLSDVTMNNLGERLAFQQFPGAAPPVPQGTLTQSFQTSDVALKSSPLFGGKVGYFFQEEGFSWLGVEVEAFTAKPNIKSQTLSTTQAVTYLPFNPNSSTPPQNCVPGIVDCLAQVRNNGAVQLSESSMRLITVAFNVVARYPGKVFQPYVGVGAGAFYFNRSSGSIQGRQVVPGLI